MHSLSALPCHFTIPNQTTSFCLISRLTYVSVFVVVTFILCITHEFTFVLNYTSYVTTSSSLQDFLVKHADVSRKNISHSNDFILDDDWRRVTDSIFVYSAYWDNRFNNESFIRIIGGAKIEKTNIDTIKCLLTYSNSTSILEASTNSTILIEHHNKPCKAVYINCMVNTDESPNYVAVVPIGWNDSWIVKPSWMTVHILQNYSFSSIGVCVRPMFNYSDVFRVSEFVAYYEALGISHFTFYHYDVSEKITNYLEALKNENYSIDVLPWSLPSNLDSLWAVGQLASINDCIYRNSGKTTHIVIVDLDEFITPTHVMTLPEVLKTQDIPEKRTASFVFRSCVFCAEYKKDILPPVIPPFRTQSDIHRESYIYPFLIRSKYIAKPYVVEMAGVHHVWKFIPGWEQRFISVHQALVHHYRRELCVGKKKTLEKGEIDVKSRKYLNFLMRSKAVEVWKNRFSK